MNGWLPSLVVGRARLAEFWAAALLWLVTAWFAAGVAPAHGAAVLADLSSHIIAIGGGFTGDSVVLFGSTDGPSDIIAVVRGPERNMTVWRKGKVAGIWINAESLTFNNLPAFYAVVASRPIDELIKPSVAALYKIGVPYLKYETASPASPERVRVFTDALIEGAAAGRAVRRRYREGDVSRRAAVPCDAQLSRRMYRPEPTLSRYSWYATATWSAGRRHRSSSRRLVSMPRFPTSRFVDRPLMARLPLPSHWRQDGWRACRFAEREFAARSCMSDSAPLRVFLVVVDETPEHRVAVRYAARRAAHTGGRVAMLYVIEPTELQHFQAIEELARTERLGSGRGTAARSMR